jgi:PilZ domain
MAMKAPFSPIRKMARFAPAKPVTVALSDDGVPMSYGILANLSESGACFQTNIVPRCPSVSILMSFYDGEYVQTTGRVVWSEVGDGLSTVGVEFTSVSEEARDRIRHNLDSREFAAL